MSEPLTREKRIATAIFILLLLTACLKESGLVLCDAGKTMAGGAVSASLPRFGCSKEGGQDIGVEGNDEVK